MDCHLIARVRKVLSDLGDVFWLLPGAMVLMGIGGAMGMLAIDRSGIVPAALLKQDWLYNGSGTGARTLLGAVASSTIGVAGTVFSITIAALTLAAGQMGPRLLRNFVRDRGNQFTLGAFLGTFSGTPADRASTRWLRDAPQTACGGLRCFPSRAGKPSKLLSALRFAPLQVAGVTPGDLRLLHTIWRPFTRHRRRLDVLATPRGQY